MRAYKRALVRSVNSAYRIWPSATSRLVGCVYNRLIDRSIYIRELNCIYMPVPKVGTVSFRRAFGEYYTQELRKPKFDIAERSAGGFPFEKLSKRKVAALRKTVFVFAFVRNPYARVASCYFHRGRNRSAYLGLLRYGEAFYVGMPFREFVERIGAIPDYDADQHFRSQHRFLTDRRGEIIPHVVGKLEDSDIHFARVLENLPKANIRLPHSHRSKPTAASYRDLYDAYTAELIQERYETDFILFDYDRELRKAPA